jgi:hypothetical protein
MTPARDGDGPLDEQKVGVGDRQAAGEVGEQVFTAVSSMAPAGRASTTS